MQRPEPTGSIAAEADVLGSIRRMLAEERPSVADAPARAGLISCQDPDEEILHRLVGTRRISRSGGTLVRNPAPQGKPACDRAGADSPQEKAGPAGDDDLRAIVAAARQSFSVRRAGPLRLDVDQRVDVGADGAGLAENATPAPQDQPDFPTGTLIADGDAMPDLVPGSPAGLQNLLTLRAWMTEGDASASGADRIAASPCMTGEQSEASALVPPAPEPPAEGEIAFNLFSASQEQQPKVDADGLLRQLVRDLILAEFGGDLGVSVSLRLRDLVQEEVRLALATGKDPAGV